MRNAATRSAGSVRIVRRAAGLASLLFLGVAAAGVTVSLIGYTPQNPAVTPPVVAPPVVVPPVVAPPVLVASTLSTFTTDSLIIWGTPANSVTVGSSYAFTPNLVASGSAMIGFSIANLPAWASFSTVNGQLTGTPAAQDAGSYANIVISASDGNVTTSMPPFTLQVVPPVAATAPPSGYAILSWLPPTTNTDGSALTDLAGYQVSFGTDPAWLNQSVKLGSDQTVLTLANLASGTWYFAVRALNAQQAESDQSVVVSKAL